MCEADSIVTINSRAHPNDPLLAQQYAAPMINATGAWQASAYGSHKIVVCMVDTGSDLYNKDLVPNLWKCVAIPRLCPARTCLPLRSARTWIARYTEDLGRAEILKRYEGVPEATAVLDLTGCSSNLCPVP